MEAVVLEIESDIVTLDFNHPLAGETLYFSGKIVEIE
jgi:FKBP-type peptidyl-prolyl cis-trans isomerase SlyD